MTYSFLDETQIAVVNTQF